MSPRASGCWETLFTSIFLAFLFPFIPSQSSNEQRPKKLKPNAVVFLSFFLPRRFFCRYLFSIVENHPVLIQEQFLYGNRSLMFFFPMLVCEIFVTFYSTQLCDIFVRGFQLHKSFICGFQVQWNPYRRDSFFVIVHSIYH